MRFIFRMSIILIAVTTLLGCTSCSDDNDKASVVGFWRLTNESSNDIYWEVKESGELIMYFYDEGFFVDEHHSTYDYNGKAFVIHFDEEDVTYSVTNLTSNELKMAALSNNYDFKRVDGLPQPKDITSADFIGHSFTADDPLLGEIVLSFISESRFSFDNLYGNYTLYGDKIILHYDNSSEDEIIQILTHKRLFYYFTELKRK